MPGKKGEPSQRLLRKRANREAHEYALRFLRSRYEVEYNELVKAHMANRGFADANDFIDIVDEREILKQRLAENK